MTTEDDDGAGATAGDWEYHPLRLPAGISRRAASTQLSINAELGGWELARTLLYSDGSRWMWLRRKRPRNPVPGVII